MGTGKRREGWSGVGRWGQGRREGWSGGRQMGTGKKGGMVWG